MYLLRIYSAAVVMSGNGFEGISLTSSIALVTFLSDLFIEAFLTTLCFVKIFKLYFALMKSF